MYTHYKATNELEVSIIVQVFFAYWQSMTGKCAYIKLISTIVWGLHKENFIEKFNRQSKLGVAAEVRQRIQYEFCPTPISIDQFNKLLKIFYFNNKQLLVLLQSCFYNIILTKRSILYERLAKRISHFKIIISYFFPDFVTEPNYLYH